VGEGYQGSCGAAQDAAVVRGSEGWPFRERPFAQANWADSGVLPGDPKDAPYAGRMDGRMRVDAHFDNSANNPANPNPNRTSIMAR
jgi:hypothetical protein